ncbi:cilia- and flagella-associated protein 298-like [Lytechinus variegatus]|uniref:cilia- and flagella-associated protein 298-like n=1 Tax=Lytechinus variegatus TaxID=7654 RepID=UPI001BB2462F|nr:cilia- and flagella-associated protein 298-like [Lytechinus variegatus]XP_041462006.1 cilia- and flagella-associated protein 298-like [Lytechinus variegatus]
MVKLHIKRGDDSQFLFETTVQQPLDDLIKQLILIHNGRLKVERICSEINELSEHGTTLPPNMQGLTDDQIIDLKLVDEWGQKCEPSGGSVECKDPNGRRNGKAPNEKMKEVLTKTVSEAKKIISKNQASANVCVTQPMIKDALDQLRGAVTIVYPMGLPPHDPIRMEFEGSEELDGTQASLSVLEEDNTSLWFSGKEMHRGKKLCDYIGKNEKTKIIAKLQKKGQGAPAREAVFSEDERKQMMLHAYKKQEEWKKMQEESEDAYLNSPWADSNQLKSQLQGINNVKWGPR